MFFECPYCDGTNLVFFGEEFQNLMREGITDYKCNHCGKVFEIYQEPDKYESRIKE